MSSRRLHKGKTLEALDAYCHMVLCHPANAAFKDELREHLQAFLRLKVGRTSPDAKSWSTAQQQAAVIGEELAAELLDPSTERLLKRFRQRIIGLHAATKPLKPPA